MFWQSKSQPPVATVQDVLHLRPAGDNSISHLALAQALFYDGQLEVALGKLELVLQDNPEIAEGQLLKGVVLSRIGQHAAAIAPLQLAAQLNPQLFVVYMLLAAVQLKLKNYPQVIEAAEHLQGQDDWQAVGYALQGEALWLMKRLDEAQAALRIAVQRGPHIFWIHEKLGRLLLESGEIEAALQELDAVARIAPTQVDALLAAGDALMNLFRTSEAAAYYQRAVFNAAPSARAYLKMGECCLEQNLLLDAVVWLRTALVLDARQAGCYHALATVYSRLGRQSVARQYHFPVTQQTAVGESTAKRADALVVST